MKPEDSRQSQAGLGSLFKSSKSKSASDQAGEAAEKIVRVVYLYGQGGLGKSFVCRETAKRFSEEYSGELYTIVLDLRQQREVENNLKCLALKQFGRMGIGGEEYAADNALHEIIDEIILQTDCYLLAVENCVEVYFRIWNKKLGDHKVTDENKAEEYRPQPDEIKQMFSDKKGKKIISNRFMKYYTQQEQEVLYTLICLETWTDRILESLIWKNTVSNTLVYEEMCSTSFIKTGDGGRKFVQGLMLEAIMEECPQNLKKNLL